MSMFSETATEVTIQKMVTEIRNKLLEAKDPGEIAAYKHMGRFALTLFEWDSPGWVKEFTALFRDTPVRKKSKRKRR